MGATIPVTARPIAGRAYVFSGTLSTSTADTPAEAQVFALRLAGPNPARETVQLTASLPEAQAARVDVFDVLGRRVAVLHDGPLAAGAQTLALDASGLSPGLYVARMTAGNASGSVRFTVVR